jgi:hypothetical protein
MNHQEKVQQFYKEIHPKGTIKRKGVIDRWLWSHGYQTPPSVVWPLWAIIIKATLIFWLIGRPLMLVPPVFFSRDPDTAFLIRLQEAGTVYFSVDALVLFVAFFGFIAWDRMYMMPWKRWREIWESLNQDSSNDTSQKSFK